ncbi:hypothetical protein PG985_002238 [Apiospora marii]|uniref:WSC domain-containing protein n=1 Tax=Apiospora marii TaxID=335849 RepID=A0ABR1RZ11_9PEZI
MKVSWTSKMCTWRDLTNSWQYLAISFLVMLVMMVVGTTSTTGTPDTPASQPILHEVKAMVTETAKLHVDSATAPAPAPQRAAMGENDKYVINCNGSYVKSFICWYYNNTRCFSGHLTSDSPDCLANCTCDPWKNDYWGPGLNGSRKLPIEVAPVDAEE